jgi:hypothetical protein
MIGKKTAPSDLPKLVSETPHVHKYGSMSASHPKRPSAMKMRSVAKGQRATLASHSRQPRDFSIRSHEGIVAQTLY